jgi:hypothetical protein
VRDHLGLVVRDHLGNLIRTQALWYEHAASASLMEALAIRDGARLAVKKGYNQIIIERNCRDVVHLINEDSQNRSVVRSICQEIRRL